MLNVKLYAIVFQVLLLRPATSADPPRRPTVLVPDGVRLPVEVPIPPDVRQLETEFPQYFPHSELDSAGQERSISEAIRAIKLLTTGQVSQTSDHQELMDQDHGDGLISHQNQSPFFTSVLTADENTPPVPSQIVHAPSTIGLNDSVPDFRIPIHVSLRVPPVPVQPAIPNSVPSSWPLVNPHIRLPVKMNVGDLNIPVRNPYGPTSNAHPDSFDVSDSGSADFSLPIHVPLHVPASIQPGIPNHVQLPWQMRNQQVQLPVKVDVRDLNIPLRNSFVPSNTKSNPKHRFHKLGSSLLDPLSYYKSKDTPEFLAKFHNRFGRKKSAYKIRESKIHPSVKMLNSNPYMPSSFTEVINQWNLHHLAPTAYPNSGVINQLEMYKNQDETGFLGRLQNQLQLQNRPSPWDFLSSSGMDRNQQTRNDMFPIQTFRPKPHIPSIAMPQTGPWSLSEQNPVFSDTRAIDQLKAYRSQDSTGFLGNLVEYIENKQSADPLFQNIPNIKVSVDPFDLQHLQATPSTSQKRYLQKQKHGKDRFAKKHRLHVLSKVIRKNFRDQYHELSK